MYVCLWIISLKQMVSLELLWHFIVAGGWWLIVGKSQCTQYMKIRLVFFATANSQTEVQHMWQFYQDVVKIKATPWQIWSGSCSALWYHSGLFPGSGDFVSVSFPGSLIISDGILSILSSFLMAHFAVLMWHFLVFLLFHLPQPYCQGNPVCNGSLVVWKYKERIYQRGL